MHYAITGMGQYSELLTYKNRYSHGAMLSNPMYAVFITRAEAACLLRAARRNSKVTITRL